MKKRSTLYWRIKSLKCRLESRRWRFWAYVKDHYPRFYDWADKHLPFDTLPF